MQAYYIFQLIEILIAYLVVFVGLPYIALHHTMKDKRIEEQLLFYFVVGNFYVMNLVYILELLHISNRITLIIGTIVPFFVIATKANQWKLRKWLVVSFRTLQMIMGKRLGKKTFGYRFRDRFVKMYTKQKYKLRITSIAERLDFVLFLIIFGLITFLYGTSIITTYGYSVSDMIVHNYWINGLIDNELFIAGIYPEGAHCITYFMHEIFGFDVYIILGLIGYIQVNFIMLALLLFMKLICKNRYLPYVGLLIYVAGNFWNRLTYFRFYSGLPQEYGMIFILPAVYYGFDYFKKQYEAVKAKKEKQESSSVSSENKESETDVPVKKSLKRAVGNLIRQEYFYSLVSFGMCFAMTFMVHFYNTFILGIFCVAMAIGYFTLFIRKEFFGKIVLTCIISLLIAVAPMAICYAFGTPLQGSITWGMNVITGDKSVQAGGTEETVNAANNVSVSNGSAYTDTQNAGNVSAGNIVESSSVNSTSVPVSAPEPVKKNIFKEIPNKLKFSLNEMNYDIFNADHEDFCYIVLATILVVLIMGTVFKILKERLYGSMLYTIGLGMLLLLVLLCSRIWGIPPLMDTGRARIFCAYIIPVCAVVSFDSILAVPVSKFSREFEMILNIIGLLTFISVVFVMFSNRYIRLPESLEVYETNEAVASLTNIIRTEKDDTWTIISANDERHMAKGHGHHEEALEFLIEIENLKEEQTKYIPTEKIFVFIEKKPIDYNGGYLIERISDEYADKRLPSSQLKLFAYRFGNRLVVMSRLNSWVNAFKEMYPNDVKVYFENSDFVCYEICQNTHRQFDLAIDYGYNTKDKDGE